MKTALFALAIVLTLSGCKDAYGQAKTPPIAIQSAGNVVVVSNGVVVTTPIMPAPIIPTPKSVYRQPNPIGLHSNITLRTNLTPSQQFWLNYARTNRLRTNAVSKHP